MANRPLPDLVQHLRRLADPDAAEPLSDENLLRLFVAQRSEDAFATLVRRHGPLVLRVCRQLLPNTHDADDAFQATFLVLVRKAASIGRRDLLAGWLYGVAHRVATRARVQSARRQAREQPVADVLVTVAPPEPGARELWAVLHEEVLRLPAKYRLPVVSCYLEGKTLEEAAQLLGWPKGTVAGRLARARDLLHRRLTRRGVAVPAAGGVALLLGAGSAPAAPPGELLRAAVVGAVAFASGPPTAGTVSASVLALAEGVLKTMLVTKLKIIVAALLVVFAVAVTVGVGFAAAGLRDGPVVAKTQTPPPKQLEAPKAEKEPDKKVDEANEFEPALVKMKPLAADPKDDELKKLMKERFNEALAEVSAGYERVLAGQVLVDNLFDAAARLKLAGLEMYDDPKEKIALLEKFLELAKEVERIMQERFDAGRVSRRGLARIRPFIAGRTRRLSCCV